MSEMQIAPHWYAVYTRPSHEKQVAKQFAAREIESYLPHYQVRRRWKNRCNKNLELPLFPSYIFVRIPLADRVRVLEVPSVLSIVGTAGCPVPLPDHDIETLRAGLQARKAEPHPFLKLGMRARIVHGPLAGLEGFVVRDNNGVRVVISLDLIMQSMAVEVAWDEVEPLASPRPAVC
jgi:transcription termination/antitermination protein NusG